VAGYIIVGTLAAFGTLCAVLIALGRLLPAGEGCAVVCWGSPDEGILSRYHWLTGMGLLRCPLLAVEAPECAGENIENCAGEDLLARLEWERNQFGTGTGNPAGRGQRRGISEL